MKMYTEQAQQLELLMVKEEGGKHIPAKRVDIVSLRMWIYFIPKVNKSCLDLVQTEKDPLN